MDSTRRSVTPSPLVLAALVTLSGCSGVDLADETRKSLRTVSVHRDIEVSGSFSGKLPGVDLTTRGTMWYSGWITAPVGAYFDVVDWSENHNRWAKAFSRRMRAADVEVGDLVREQFFRELSEADVFGSVVEWGGDAVFSLKVDYGLADGWGARGSWKPWLEVEGVLVDADGRVLWRESTSIASIDDRLPELFRPFKSPRKLRTAYRVAAKILAAELIEDLKG